MKINWLEEKVQYALTHSAPKGFRVNKQAIRGIAKGLIRNNGACPCPHEEWDENTPHEDKLCPCKTFRDTGKCHCNLYHREQEYQSNTVRTPINRN